jgi:hypothetical protein
MSRNLELKVRVQGLPAWKQLCNDADDDFGVCEDYCFNFIQLANHPNLKD